MPKGEVMQNRSVTWKMYEPSEFDKQEESILDVEAVREMQKKSQKKRMTIFEQSVELKKI